MQAEKSELNDLAMQAKLGDRAAGQALCQTVEPHLELLIREALRGKHGPFAQQVSAVANEIAANCQWVSTPEQFVQLLARRLSVNLTDRCAAGTPCNHWSKETVRDERAA